LLRLSFSCRSCSFRRGRSRPPAPADVGVAVTGRRPAAVCPSREEACGRALPPAPPSPPAPPRLSRDTAGAAAARAAAAATPAAALPRHGSGDAHRGARAATPRGAAARGAGRRCAAAAAAAAPAATARRCVAGDAVRTRASWRGRWQGRGWCGGHAWFGAALEGCAPSTAVVLTRPTLPDASRPHAPPRRRVGAAADRSLVDVAPAVASAPWRTAPARRAPS